MFGIGLNRPMPENLQSFVKKVNDKSVINRNKIANSRYKRNGGDKASEEHFKDVSEAYRLIMSVLKA